MPTIVAGFGTVGIQFQCVLVTGDRRIQFLPGLECRSQIVEGGHVIRFAFSCQPVGRDRFVEFALIFQDVAEVICETRLRPV